MRVRGRLFRGDALRFPKSYPLRLICLALIGAVIWLASEPEGVSEHGGDVTPFLLAFAVILLAARAGGEIFERLNQPAVLGELVFGILLGNLGLLGLQAEALRDTPFLAVAAEIGVILLLFQVGLECDLDDLLAAGSRRGC